MVNFTLASQPNDQDPHLIIDEDLKDGKVGKEMGKVFDDPTHGSDIAVFRDDDGTFQIIYEDWSPINAQKTLGILHLPDE